MANKKLENGKMMSLLTQPIMNGNLNRLIVMNLNRLIVMKMNLNRLITFLILKSIAKII